MKTTILLFIIPFYLCAKDVIIIPKGVTETEEIRTLRRNILLTREQLKNEENDKKIIDNNIKILEAKLKQSEEAVTNSNDETKIKKISSYLKNKSKIFEEKHSKTNRLIEYEYLRSQLKYHELELKIIYTTQLETEKSEVNKLKNIQEKIKSDLTAIEFKLKHKKLESYKLLRTHYEFELNYWNEFKKKNDPLYKAAEDLVKTVKLKIDDLYKKNKEHKYKLPNYGETYKQLNNELTEASNKARVLGIYDRGAKQHISFLNPEKGKVASLEKKIKDLEFEIQLDQETEN